MHVNLYVDVCVYMWMCVRARVYLEMSKLSLMDCGEMVCVYMHIRMCAPVWISVSVCVSLHM